MKNKLLTILYHFVLLINLCNLHAVNAEVKSDVLIYSATPAGIMAAVAVQQSGLKALIIEPTKHIGGIMTSGLGASDQCNPRFVGGLAREYFKRIGKFYNHNISWRFEPHVGQTVFDGIIEENKIQILRFERLLKVHKNNNKITSISTTSGKRYSAHIFIDASYEGDLMAAAGISYRIGRESRAEFDEPDAGLHEAVPRFQFPVPISAYDSKGKLLPGILDLPLNYGAGDDKTMAYNYRLCISTDPNNSVPIPRPNSYNALDYELLARWLTQRPNTSMRQIFNFLDIPNKKYDLNNIGPFSTNFTGGNWNYPEASLTERQNIIAQHTEYTKGLFHFLKTDPRIPVRIRELTERMGLCKDEFTNNNNWPPLLYVRVARRMQGQYFLTQNDMSTAVKHTDAVAIGVCPIESHGIQRLVVNGFVFNEGWANKRVTPYLIPFRSITPKNNEALNLLVPVSVSASHIAYSSLRMEPVFMTLGETAGLAATMAIRKKIPVQELPVADLQELMKERKMRFRLGS